MNIMILSPGRRVEVIEFFKTEVKKYNGQVFAIDMNENAPALYVADKYFVVKKDFQCLDKYIKEVLEICLDNNIKAIITLIDPELILLSKYKQLFEKNNIKVIVSDQEIISDTFDKYNFYKKYKNVLPLVPTYENVENVLAAIKRQELKFPIFCKKRTGSGSEGISIINTKSQLLNYHKDNKFIFQMFAKKREFGVDAFFDMVDLRIKNIFIKEKISMRSGETDKSISIIRNDLLKVINQLEKIKGLRGPIDVDIFEAENGQIYINEINPRFGGGYVHAHKQGVNFIEMLMKNIAGDINMKNELKYECGKVMMKYSASIIR